MINWQFKLTVIKSCFGQTTPWYSFKLRTVWDKQGCMYGNPIFNHKQGRCYKMKVQILNVYIQKMQSKLYRLDTSSIHADPVDAYEIAKIVLEQKTKCTFGGHVIIICSTLWKIIKIFRKIR